MTRCSCQRCSTSAVLSNPLAAMQVKKVARRILKNVGNSTGLLFAGGKKTMGQSEGAPCDIDNERKGEGGTHKRGSRNSATEPAAPRTQSSRPTEIQSQRSSVASTRTRRYRKNLSCSSDCIRKTAVEIVPNNVTETCRATTSDSGGNAESPRNAPPSASTKRQIDRSCSNRQGEETRVRESRPEPPSSEKVLLTTMSVPVHVAVARIGAARIHQHVNVLIVAS